MNNEDYVIRSMIRGYLVPVMTLVLLLMVQREAMAIPNEPIAIDTGPQFVHDDHLVDNTWVPRHPRAAVVRRFHTPRRYESNPVLSGDRFSYFSIHRGDDGKFRLWYQLFNPETLLPDTPKSVPRYGIAYAESDDGLSWHRPEVGLLEWRGSKKNNVVWLGATADTAAGGFVLALPENDASGYRYAMLYQGHSGMNIAGSSDGIHWDRDGNVHLKRLHSDTFNAVVHDPQRNRYLLYCRPRNIYRNHEDPGDEGGVRRIAVMASDKLWSEWNDEPRTILVPDEIDVAREFTFFYGMPVRRYGGVFWGFLWPFKMNTTIVTELAFSRNGEEWQRLPDRPRLVETGPEGAWDDGMVTAMPFWIEVGDEWWIYYNGVDGPHNRARTNTNGLGLLKLRKEGFISRHGPAGDGGRLCTRPMIWPGGDLVINAEARDVLRVRVTDPMRRPISGFGFDDIAGFRGDNVEQPLRWGQRSLDELKGQAIRLEFELRDADLYTFRATGTALSDTQLATMHSKQRPVDAMQPDATANAGAAGTADPDTAMEPVEQPPGMEQADGSDDIHTLPPVGEALISLDFDDQAGTAVENTGTAPLSLRLGLPGKEAETTPTRIEDGLKGAALQIDGVDDIIHSRQIKAPLPDSGTLRIAFRADRPLDRSLDMHKYLFLLYGDSKNRDFLLAERGSGRLIYQSMRRGEPTVILRSVDGFQAGQWHEVTIAFGPGGHRLFVDGKLLDRSSPQRGLSDLANPTLYLGNVPAELGEGYAFPGAIDEFRLEKTPATQHDTPTEGALEQPQGQQPTTQAVTDPEAPPPADIGSPDSRRRRQLADNRPSIGVIGQPDAAPSAAITDGRLVQFDLSGRQLLPERHDVPLWTLELASNTGDQVTVVTSRGGNSWKVESLDMTEPAGALASGRWQISSQVTGEPVAVVEAWVSPAEDGAADFHFAVDHLDPSYLLRRAWYPQLPLHRLGEQAGDDFLVVPSMHGQILRDVHARSAAPWGRGHGDMLQAVHRTRYPSKFGNLQMQFYGDVETGGGILFMTLDGQRRIKDLVVDRASDHSLLQARFGHHLSPEVPLLKRVELPYPVRVRWINGDWYDAARVYRQWAMQQAWATPPLALGNREDLPDWFRGLPSWVRIPADPKIPMEEKTRWPLIWEKAVGGPMGVHWYGWDRDGGPFNKRFPDYVDPYAGFDSLVRQYQDAAIHVMPYINARLIDMDSSDIWSKYKNAVVRGRDGEPAATERWPYYATAEEADLARRQGKSVSALGQPPARWFHVMHRFAVGWIGAELWQAALWERNTRLFLEHDVDAVYQDQLGVYPMFQHRPTDDELPADPLAWQEQEETFYGRLREHLQKQGVKPVLVAEYLNESVLPNVVGGLTATNIGDASREPIPLFNTVYHTHFASIGWEDDSSQLDDPKMYLHGRLVPLTWGAQLGWISYVIPKLVERHEPITAAFREAVLLRRKYPEYLGWGRMLRPPALVGVDRLDAPLPRPGGTRPMPWPAILAGLFQHGNHPSRAIAVFANWTDEPRSAMATVDLKELEGPLLATLPDGSQQALGKAGSLRLQVALSPMSIQVLSVKEAKP